MNMTPRDPIAETCGLLLARGIAAREVIAVAARLRLIAEGGLAVTIELPEYAIAVTLPPAGGARRRHLHRPGCIA